MPLEVPILENAYNNTVLDLVLCTDRFLTARKDNESETKENLDPSMLDYPNVSLAAVIFRNLKDYTMFHDGPLLVDAVIKAIEL